MPERPTRQQIFAKAAAKLREEFEELRTVPHPGVKGGEAEAILRRFLNDRLPQRFKATGGFIIDSNDVMTGHNEVIIYDALNCPLYRASENAAIIPNDKVAAVIEVKSRLNKEDLQNGFDKIREAKSLVKSPLSPLEKQVSPYINHETLGVLFAFTSDISRDTALNHYQDMSRTTGIPLHLDYVVTLDRFILQLTIYRDDEWQPTVLYAIPPIEGLHVAVIGVEAGDAALDMFIRYILAHLMMFRHRVDHRGFDWAPTPEGGKPLMSYLMSVTFEPDQERREFLERVYVADARRILTGL